ncbi:MAG: phosphate acetyltransferase [Sulfurimonadaceae bacterium]|nr:phosphate acetyltransferase [Sulfurimonadaceae bacterium]
MKTKSLYIASLEPLAGSLFVTVGLMEFLRSRVGRVAFFRPVIEGDFGRDEDIVFILEQFGLQMHYEEAYGYTVSEVETMVSEHRSNELHKGLISKFKALQNRFDFVLCEGLHRYSFTATFDFDMNIEIAKNLGTPYISIINGKGKERHELEEEIRIESECVGNECGNHFATFVNRLEPMVLEQLQHFLERGDVKGIPHFLLPEIDELDLPTVGDVMESLEAVRLFGEEEDLTRVVRQSKIAAMNLENYLTYMQEGDLVIVPGDRADIIMGSLGAFYSKNYPHISGILLTGGIVPDFTITELLHGFRSVPVPILATDTDTYTTAMQIKEAPSKIRPHSDRKIALAMGSFNAHVDASVIEAKIEVAASSVVTPAMFEYELFERARSKRKKIVLPESGDERILRAAEILARRDVVDVVLLGEPDKVRHKGAMLGLDLEGVEIVCPCETGLMDEFVERFYEMRRTKGLLEDAARDAMTHSTYFATMMVYLGYADGMVSGAVHTTGDTIRPALQIIKTKEGISTVSSVFFMCLDTRVLVYGDCAVNQDPDARQLAEIAVSSADTARMFGIEPKIAMLSYSTGTSGQGADVDKVREATRIAKEMRPDLLLEGPIQYDAAIDPEVAIKKLPESEVAGQATIFIFPDLNTGNNTYKAVQRSSGAVAIGPVLQGLKKPINDLSRGCSVADIVNTVAITAIQAQGD